MYNLLEYCTVCLSNTSALIKSSETDANQMKWGSKLSLCVPQLIWNDECCICSSCIEQLQIAYTFHCLCVQSYEVRKQQEQLIKSEEASHDLKNNSDFIANSCENESEVKCVSFTPINFINRDIAVQNKDQFLESDPEICSSTNIFLDINDEESVTIKEEDLKTEQFCSNEKSDTTTNKPKEICNSTNISLDYNDEESFILKEEEDLKTEQFCSNEKNNTTKNKPKATRKSKYPKKCDYCTKYFKRKQHLDEHVRRYHTLEKPYTCDECGAKFATSHNLKMHKNKHTNIRPFVCSSCGKTFPTSSCLYHHTQIHLNKRQYKCDMCEKSFNTTSILQAHKVCVHMDPKLWKYPCTFCEKRFPLKSGLTAHVRRHTGEKNFECHICSKRFSDKAVVLRHIRSHTNERLFKCHLCAKEYKAEEALNVHLKRDHDVGTARVPKPVPKTYVCHVCSKAFVTGIKLEKHIRSHTGEKPFSCNVCRKKFTDGWCLKVHMKSKHGQEGVDDNHEVV